MLNGEQIGTLWIRFCDNFLKDVKVFTMYHSGICGTSANRIKEAVNYLVSGASLKIVFFFSFFFFFFFFALFPGKRYMETTLCIVPCNKDLTHWRGMKCPLVLADGHLNSSYVCFIKIDLKIGNFFLEVIYTMLH